MFLLLPYMHCVPDQSPTVICGGCGRPLMSPLDGPFDPAVSTALDQIITLYDRMCECHIATEVLP